jgi:glycosyltransferase involved in cell wall biosynthesis
MKILHIISSVNPTGGGPIEGIKQLGEINSLKGGHQVEIACLDLSDSLWIQNFPLKIYALGSSISKYRFSKNLLPWLKQNASNYDCIIVNGIWQYSSFGTWRALKWLRKHHHPTPPYFVFTHGMLDPWFKRTYPLKHLKKWLYWPWAEYRVLRDAKAIFFTCEEERTLARQSFWLYRCNEVVVHYGTSEPPTDIAQQTQSFWAKFPELRAKRIILFLSRIHVKKGCDLLINAFAQVAQTDPSLHLVMAGPDQTGWQTDLQNMAQKLGISQHITWTDMLQDELKWGAFRAAEVFILPSHQENFGIAVAEALACSLPVLISNKVNIWREIEADGAGLVANDDLEGTTELFQKWLALSPQAQQNMRQNAQKCFTERFEITKAAQNLIEVLTSYQ